MSFRFPSVTRSLTLLMALLFATSFPAPLMAIDCLPIETSLNTQEQIDSFQDTYGGGNICDTVKGGLVIGAGDIVNLDGLSDIRVVTRDLWFNGTIELVNVNGLSNLTTIGGELRLDNNQALTTLSGLSNLVVVGEDIDIWGNAALENLDGLSGLTYLNNGLIVIENPSLSDVDGLANLSYLGNLNVQSNVSLSTIGLSSLRKVEGSVVLEENTALLNVDGLVNLAGVGDYFRLAYNTNLADCSGLLRLLDDVDDFEPGPEIGSDLPDVGGNVYLINNQPGCNLIEEILTVLKDGFESQLNSITVQFVAENPIYGNSIAIGADGKPVISFIDEGALIVAKCENEICTSSTIHTVDDPENDLSGPSIAIGSDGLPVIAYVDRTAENLKVAKCNDQACAGGNENISTVDDPDNSSGWYASIAIGQDGLPIIGYLDRTARALKVAKCDSSSCAGTNQISTLNAYGIKSSIAIDADGFPIINFLAAGSSPSEGTVRIAKCNDVACAGGDETISIVDDSSMIGFGASTALTIGANNLPAIVSYDVLDDEIRVVACNDIACSGADETITKIDRGGGAQRLSIVTGADGFPVISYRDGFFGALKVAKCNNFECSNLIISRVDSLGDVGTSSIAIGDDSLPIVSYGETGSNSLKIVHCGRPSCL